ncbi:murein hydrolase activator EnvC [Rhizobium sp. DKSPLA3]|uniref:Murein hydrolase activator EnvC n=1 Tax=Rhizobium quercicola TaxID=2901226 RepID=A0A9X1NPX6_9HYPH|nr:murein hydrolase activator EnvC [Rhizobium quercicola]MCD7108233.1 murein hydrolase activator EnvC [Rhizobium quercicola]
MTKRGQTRRGKAGAGDRTVPRGHSLPRGLLISTLLTAFAPVALPAYAQEAERGDRPAAAAPEDPAAALSQRRNNTRIELEALSKTIGLSQERALALQSEIADIEKTNESLRQALVESAGKRQALERQIADGEGKLADLRLREDTVHQSLKARRGVLAEVLAALQRMGRNPPPALLVTPEDALGSVRSAILLGAVVPGIRHETENLAADLQALAGLRTEIVNQKQALGNDMTARLEEERRMNMLVAEKEKLKDRNTTELAAERRKAEQLASQATSLQGLIGSLETEIGSVRAAAEAARAEEEARARLSEAEREAARALARNAVPDKNRIAPAYEFSELQKKLAFPVAGSVLRRYGEDDGTGHSSQGMMLRTDAGALVTAPADGWVMFAGVFRSYGQMIILNPGDGYLVVLSGMETVAVQPGQFVVAGEPLGQMGAKRVASAAALALETDRPTLYIEFRKDGKPVDSRPWWTASDTGKVRNDS